MHTSFVLVTELTRAHPDWAAAMAQAQGLQASLEPRLGLAPRVRLASLPRGQPDRLGDASSSSKSDLARVLTEEAERGPEDVFVIPTMLDFGLVQRAALTEIVAEIRLEHHGTAVSYDDVVLDSRPLVQALSERIYQSLADSNLSPERSGLLLLATGDGDSSGRARSYQLMRLLFDQLGFARGEVAFLDHARPLAEEQMERCAREPLAWVVVPQTMWRSEPVDDALCRLDAFRQTHPEATQWMMMSPVGISSTPVCEDPIAFNLASWIEERMMVLWRSRRRQLESKRSSPMRGESPRISYLRGPHARVPLAESPPRVPDDLWYGDGCIAEIFDQRSLTNLLSPIWESRPAGRFFIKVTWHGYATGTYSDSVALDKLLAALPGRAVLVEGHTSSRNLGGSSWDWQTDGHQHRAWIAEQDAEYLRRTGIDEVIRKHDAQYLNVTEAYWDGQCAPRASVEALLADAGVELHFPELAEFVPDAFLEHPDAPFISFARFKGPQRASVTNMFGLIPTPLRTAWHGRTSMHFARVCCDIVKVYRCLFRTYGMVESLNVAVKWNPKGLYRSRWGNYDLIANPGIVTLSDNLPTADVLASRLQGQPVDGNEFYRTVREEIGFPAATAELPIPEDLMARLI